MRKNPKQIKVSLKVSQRIKTVDDLNDYFAYMERFGDEVEYSFPESELNKIKAFMSDIRYICGEYNSDNVVRILAK